MAACNTPERAWTSASEVCRACRPCTRVPHCRQWPTWTLKRRTTGRRRQRGRPRVVDHLEDDARRQLEQPLEQDRVLRRDRHGRGDHVGPDQLELLAEDVGQLVEGGGLARAGLDDGGDLLAPPLVGHAEPIATLMSSAVRSPMRRLYIFLMYWMIASSISLPATRTALL